MSDAGSETFALAHCGIGRSAAPRVLAQRLASFSPQTARGVDPLLVARVSGLSASELDLAALMPQPLEEGAPTPVTTMPRNAVSEPAERAWADNPAAPLCVDIAPFPAPPDAMASLPYVAGTPAEVMELAFQPLGDAAARAEVFALAGAASALPRIAALAPDVPHGSPDLAADTPAAPGLPAQQAVAQALPVARSPSIEVDVSGSSIASPPRDERAWVTPQLPLATRADPSDAAPSPPAQLALADDLPPSESLSARLPANTEPIRPQVVSKPSVLPATPMGLPAAPAGAPRLPPEAPAHAVLERLAQATRKLDDEAVVRIGSVSVVMRPAAPVPLPQPMPALAPPPAAPVRSAYRNPWLSRGRGIE